MRTLLASCALFPLLVLAQAPSATTEDDALRQALRDSNNSPQGFIRELDAFLQKFPHSEHRADVETALFRSAMSLKDPQRIATYGESILGREPDNRLVLENVAAAEIKLGREPYLSRALDHARHLDQLPAAASSATGAEGARQHIEEARTKARALLYMARATGMLGKPDQAAPIAVESFDAYPNAESAREAGHWLNTVGDLAEAARYLADAFIMPDTGASDDARAGDRVKLGEVYQKWKGSSAGLGDLVLKEYDRTSALLAERQLALKRIDPNLKTESPLEFTLSALEGPPLKLETLKGKVIVMDFWATWCGPCRIQHPLIEKVKQHFKDRPEVVFLAVNAGEERDVVEPFIKSQGWSREIYFEDGLATLLRVNSLPTTLIFDRRGNVMDRMAGFLPDRFAAQLTKEITQAIDSKPKDASRGGA